MRVCSVEGEVIAAELKDWVVELRERIKTGSSVLSKMSVM